MEDLTKKYKKLSPIEHVLLKPGMYVGDIDMKKEILFIFSEKKIIQKEIDYSPALYKIFDEIIVNSYDQTIRDKTVSTIKVDIKNDSFSCFNDGVGIDIAIHPEHKIYIPELIFANLMTSTNYDDSEQRITGGTHGLGAKLVAIFSEKFIIEVWDKKRNLYYYQEIENNLSKINKAVIKKQSEKTGGIKITVFPDFERFKIKDINEGMIHLFEKRVIDLIGLVPNIISIELNNNKLIESSWKNYLSFYANDWLFGSCIKNQLWEFAIRFGADTHISFVNGIYTSRGGKHLDYFFDLILNKLQKMVHPDLTKKLLKDYLNVALKSSIINPSFSSQTKEELMTPVPKFGMECFINPKFWDEIKKSNIIEKLKQVVSYSTQKILSKLEGSKKSKIKGIYKLEDANYAGTKKSTECTLILTEGDSAKATAIAGISAIKDGRNYFGVYPLRGKLLNVREASTSQLSNNNEINELKKILGLKSGVKREELRYNSVMFMMDADEDGSHIKGLILNFFDFFYPHLLEQKDFIKILVTPVVKATQKDKVFSFQNLRAYSTWKETNDSTKWNIKYYKGLGTSTSKEAQEYFLNLDKNTIDILEKGSNTDILLAFAKEKIEDRKKWLIKYDPENILQLEPPMTITIKQFVNQELIHFSNYDNIRSIPSIIDGFKPSQRKVIYACLKKNLVNEMKIDQLSGAVAEITAYHHGEQSLVGTIINLAQNFVGSNNVNLLEPIGQLGTRLMGGKDHSSARYIFTKLTSIINKLIKKEDQDILESQDDDGFPIEPKNYLPIVPLCLVNGCEGIGTGFSTNIPSYNLNEIILWYKNKLEGKKNNDLIPYYNGFKGRIFSYDETTWISEGILTIEDNKIIISELPVKLWTSDYKEFLEILVEEKNSLFKSYQNLSSDTEINFIIKIEKENIEKIQKMYDTIDSFGMRDLYKLLHLYKTIKTSNLTLYNTNWQLESYKNVSSILEEFYTFRLEQYEKRRLKSIELLEKDKEYYFGQLKFIELVMNNNKIFKLEDESINDYLKDNKIKKYKDSYDYIINLSFKQLNKTNLDRLNLLIKEINNKIKELTISSKKDLWLKDLSFN